MRPGPHAGVNWSRHLHHVHTRRCPRQTVCPEPALLGGWGQHHQKTSLATGSSQVKPLDTTL